MDRQWVAFLPAARRRKTKNYASQSFSTTIVAQVLKHYGIVDKNKNMCYYMALLFTQYIG